MSKSRKKSKRLFVLWMIGYIATGIAGKIYIESFRYRMGYPPTEMGGGYHLTILAVMLLLLCPLLYYTQMHAKKEDARGILILSRILLVHHSVWIIGSIILMIVK